jgi:hypothetical protein
LDVKGDARVSSVKEGGLVPEIGWPARGRMEEESVRKISYVIIAVVIVVLLGYGILKAYSYVIQSREGIESIEVTIRDSSGDPVPNVPIGFCGDENPGDVWFMAWNVGETDGSGHFTILKEEILKQSEHAQAQYYVSALAVGYVGGRHDHVTTVSLDARGTYSVDFVFEKYANWYDGLSATLGSYTPSWYEDYPTICYEPITYYPSTGWMTAKLISTPEIILLNDGMAVEKFGAYIDFSNEGSTTVLWQGYDESIDEEVHVFGESFVTGASLTSPLEITFQKSSETAYGKYSLHICEITYSDAGYGLTPVKSFDFGIMVWDQS